MVYGIGLAQTRTTAPAAEESGNPCCARSGVIVKWLSGNVMEVETAEGDGGATFRVQVYGTIAPLVGGVGDKGQAEGLATKAAAIMPVNSLVQYRTFNDLANMGGVVPARDVLVTPPNGAPLKAICEIVRAQTALIRNAPEYDKAECD